MKPSWRVHRYLQASPDGARQWDRAYQHLKGHPLRTCHDERCPSHYIPAKALDALVWDDGCALLAHPKSIAYAFGARTGWAAVASGSASPS